jgi:hypothetical protein
MIAKIFDEINNLLKKFHGGELAKKRPHVNGTIISVAKYSYKKNDVQ